MTDVSEIREDEKDAKLCPTDKPVVSQNRNPFFSKN